MRNRRFIFGAILLVTFLSAAMAADVGGKWKGEMKTPDGQAMEVNFDFQVNGEQLTGKVTNQFGEEKISEGTVKGDEVSFVVLAGEGQFKIVYKGKIAGDELKFMVTVGDFGNMELTAKRVK
jgi:opacity protein-like surface antigen